MVKPMARTSVLLLTLFGMAQGMVEFFGSYDNMTRVSLKEVDPNAVCNDGSEGVYYFKKSPTNSDRWLVTLLGTVGCNDAKECQVKSEDKTFTWGGGMSSKTWN